MGSFSYVVDTRKRAGDKARILAQAGAHVRRLLAFLPPGRDQVPAAAGCDRRGRPGRRRAVLRGAAMTGRPGPPPGDQPAAEDDAEQWREAARLRCEHPRWVVIWLAPIRKFRAYARLPGTRRDTALTGSTPAGLADQIGQAEQASHSPKDRM
jgi:hypothetical protein